MPKALSQYHSETPVVFGCYHYRCRGVHLWGVLKKEQDIHPSFSGSERIRWQPGTTVRSFQLEQPERCHACQSIFVTAIIVSNGRLKKPTIFGYEAKGA